MQERFKEQGQVIHAIDGLQPDVGHEILRVLRDCLSGEVLLARSLLSACEADLADLLREVQQMLDGVPIHGVISDGQHSIRNAVQTVLPDVPHQLCHFHYLREAAKPVYEADRHAKKELKKHLRGIRPIERAVEQRQDEEAEAIRGYCLAVRSALTDDGRPPLAAPGLKLYERITAIAASLTRVSEKGAYRVRTHAAFSDKRTHRNSRTVVGCDARICLGASCCPYSLQCRQALGSRGTSDLRNAPGGNGAHACVL